MPLAWMPAFAGMTKKSGIFFTPSERDLRLTGVACVGLYDNMRARLLLDRRVPIREGAFMELVLWAIPGSVRGSSHGYKYRLALVARGECVLRYDNEAGKGDHVHIGSREHSYAFVDAERLVADFWADVTRWLHENPDA